MQSKVRDCTSVINTLNQKCTKIDDLTARVQIMDRQISERNRAQIALHTSNENMDIIIYGLYIGLQDTHPFRYEPARSCNSRDEMPKR